MPHLFGLGGAAHQRAGKDGVAHRRVVQPAVESAMQAAIGADSTLDQCLDLYTVGHVGAHEQAVATFAFDQFDGFIALVAQVADDDLGAVTAKNASASRGRYRRSQARPFR